MDTWGIVILLLSVLLYLFSKRKPLFLFTAGVGTGILIGAIWATAIINRTIDTMFR